MVTNGDPRPDWVRARRSGEKAERRAAMLEAAAGLLEAEDFGAINMAALARAAGVAKGNLYRYFESKEALFLALYIEDLEVWIEAVQARLLRPRARRTPERVAKDLVEVVVAHPRLCKLTALLSSVLERNVSFEVALEFKAAAAQGIEALQQILVRALPRLEGAALLPFLHHLQALVAGLWPMANPNPVLAQALERDALQHLAVDFERTLEAALLALLRDLAPDKES